MFAFLLHSFNIATKMSISEEGDKLSENIILFPFIFTF